MSDKLFTSVTSAPVGVKYLANSQVVRNAKYVDANDRYIGSSADLLTNSSLMFPSGGKAVVLAA